LLRQRKKAKKGERKEAVLRIRVKMKTKTGNETNSPPAQTSFISYPFSSSFLRQLPSAIRPVLTHIHLFGIFEISHRPEIRLCFCNADLKKSNSIQSVYAVAPDELRLEAAVLKASKSDKK
jgi:hypothetical protein